MVYLQEIKKKILQEDFPKSPHLFSLEETFFPFWTLSKVSTNTSLVQFHLLAHRTLKMVALTFILVCLMVNRYLGIQMSHGITNITGSIL